MRRFLIQSLAAALKDTNIFNNTIQGLINALGIHGIDWSDLSEDEKQIAREAAELARRG